MSNVMMAQRDNKSDDLWKGKKFCRRLGEECVLQMGHSDRLMGCQAVAALSTTGTKVEKLYHLVREQAFSLVWFYNLSTFKA